MKIAVIGTGYVGLVTGTCFAETGNKVICVDVDARKVELLKQGLSPIYEPELDTYLKRNIKAERLSFTTDLAKAVEHAEIFFLALPTPPSEDGSADLSYVLKASADIARLAKSYKIVVTKSTVPVGTVDKVRAVFKEHCSAEIDVVSNPEFLKEGSAIEDFMRPDRVVVGTSSDKAKKIMAELYAPYVRQGNPIVFMDERSAELTKYAANAFLATKISFMNEIANLCEKVGANVDMIRKGIGTDARIGNKFLFAGIGYGGSCFPKDVQALAETSKEYDFDFKILESVMAANTRQKLVLVEKIKKYYNNSLKGKHFALWGLAFKPGTDDIREAPALAIIDELLQEGATISAYDPEAANNVQKLLGDKITYAKDLYEALNNADALLIATEWTLFRTPEFDEVSSRLKNKVIFDGRNLYEMAKMNELGFDYFSIGR